ncbi:hemerythrin domain-containing protein [Pyxidicoccus sp. MSG2]|uniref:hemerythrin domain-containing protein n=1 Tax=Pyxidicoccus sp. MSG2 TaxID=2996790 RepID=UPI00226E06D5|nr:hemerythrin domain-containing protein [Pyxidicoccus sp. MSG2]MCY1017976.1 hemerythrin domain-containing protein [Pyxidicoccus sp. MSG2]
MDVIDLLIQQHREVDALFEAFRNAQDDASRKELCIQLAEALTLHSTIEERWIYPVARRVIGEDKIQHSVDEHGEMKSIIADMLRARNDVNGLAAKVGELEKVVKAHVADEEKNVLPQFGQKVTEKEIGMSCNDIVRTASAVRREEMNKLEGQANA